MWNRYSYSGNNPVAYKDRDGRAFSYAMADNRPASPEFVQRVERAMAAAAKKSVRVESMIENLRASPNDHQFAETRNSGTDTSEVKATDEAAAQNGKGSGSVMYILNVDLTDTLQVVPLDQVLAHELSHAEDNDTGTLDRSPECKDCASVTESKAVRMENQAGGTVTQYGGRRVANPKAIPPDPRKTPKAHPQ